MSKKNGGVVTKSLTKEEKAKELKRQRDARYRAKKRQEKANAAQDHAKKQHNEQPKRKILGNAIGIKDADKIGVRIFSSVITKDPNLGEIIRRFLKVDVEKFINNGIQFIYSSFEKMSNKAK